MRLDSRTWLLWGFAASLPAVVGRNPFVLIEILLIAGCIHVVSGGDRSWSWLLRLIGLFTLLSVVFNVLTVRSGNVELFTIWARLPVVGGSVTLNALLYGVSSGLAVFCIVLVWLQVASCIDWMQLMRHVPNRFAHVAVAGSVAWSYLPNLRNSMQEIRESQMARGWRMRGVRDVPALVVPMLAGGLERSMLTAEVLETRGFGRGSAQTGHRSSAVVLLASLLLLVCGGYALALASHVTGAVFVGCGVLLLLLEMRRGSEQVTSRWREDSLSRTDLFCMAAAICSLLATLLTLVIDAEALQFNPYPELDWPSVNPLYLLALLPLFAPAFGDS